MEKFKPKYESSEPEAKEYKSKSEKSKEKIKEIKRMIEQALAQSLEGTSLEKESGAALWLKREKDKLLMVYLQRSAWGPDYYIEAGVCRKKDIP
ncbi:MAG: DUF4304 domain-containing protein, partial [Patescibacteria group bacterium]